MTVDDFGEFDGFIRRDYREPARPGTWSGAEWFAATADEHRQLVERLGPRRSRLLVAAWCRTLAAAASGPVAAAVGEVAEALDLLADAGRTRATSRRRRRAVEAVRRCRRSGSPQVGCAVVDQLVVAAELAALWGGPQHAAWGLIQAARSVEGAAAVDAPAVFYRLYVDIAGPTLVPAFDPDWRTASAVALARTMYDGRDFAHLPILADALEDAGCADEAVIGHCRDPDGVHVRGCWVVDLVLGRS